MKRTCGIMDNRVVVGISGGVDSFMATRLLQEQGYEVIGVHLELWGVTDEQKLKCIADSLNIEIIRYEAKDLFRQEIVERFVEGYLQGKTPNPCAICNNIIKWRLLLEVADKLGVNWVATGHYVEIVNREGIFFIRKGVDPNKDQSYFLWGVEQEVLARSLTPLGTYRKQEIKQMALERGFVEMARQAESMGVCFLQGEDYRSFIRRYRGETFNDVRGLIRTREGVVLGEHEGILNYTVGQKRGIPLVAGKPMYVASINQSTHELIVDRKATLEQRVIRIHNLHFIDRSLLKADNLEVKVRGLGLNPTGYITILDENTDELVIELATPAWAIASGQPVALYQEDYLIGGGEILEVREA